MKFFLYNKINTVVLFLLLHSGLVYTQIDSVHHSSRGLFGFFIGGGVRQMNFSELNSVPYMLNQPPNYFFQMNDEVYLGNPDKFFVSIPFGCSLNRFKTGSFNNNKTQAGALYAFGGLRGCYQIYRNNNNKIINAVYPYIGLNYTLIYISSSASIKGPNGAVSSSVLYEDSHVNTFFVDAGVMIELFKVYKRKTNSAFSPLTIKLGYNFQLLNPDWSYGYGFINPKPNRNTSNDSKMNLGGFYISVGINFWFSKGKNKLHAKKM